MTIKTNYFDGTSYSSLDFIAPFASLLTDGVFNISGGTFLVSATSPSSLSVNIAVGTANNNGYFTSSDSVVNVSIASNTSGYNRIDSIVLNVDTTNKVTTIIAVQGIPSSSPVAPTLTSNQLALANITVGNNVSVLDNNVITDRRADVDFFNGFMNVFKSQSLGSLGVSGYQRLPNGMILQWGRVTNTSSGTGTVTFPVAFPNACNGVFPAIQPSGYNAISVRIPTINLNNFTWESINTSGSQVAPGFVLWWAIGH